MMQEEELVIKDELPTTVVENRSRRVMSFSSGDPNKFMHKKYSYNYYEVIAALVMAVSTISGGLLEGYTSPAIPSMLQCPPTLDETVEDTYNQTESVNESLPLLNHPPDCQNISFTIGNNSSTILCSKNNTDGASNLVQNEFGSEVNDSLESSDEVHKISELQNTTVPNGTVTSGLSISMQNYTESVEHQCSSSTIHISEEEASWLGSLLLLGACVGSFASPWIISLGRRHAVLISAFPRFIGWMMIAASPSVSLIYAGRVLTGISVGIVTSAAPIYISEISHPSLRGSLSYLVQLGVNTGIFLASLFGTFLSWRGLAVFGAVSVVLYFLPTLKIPNSPSWLVCKGRENEARKVLSKLRSCSHNTEEELQQIINVAKEKSVSWRDLFRERRCRLPLLLVLLVTAINRFSGYNAIITYCATFLHQAVPAVSPYWGAVAVSLIQIVGTAAAIPLVDRIGRRKLLLCSVLCMGSSLLFLAICELFVSLHRGMTWLVVAATMFYVGAYATGIGPLTWVLLGEMFPLDARDRASAIVATLNWLAAFFITKTYFSLESFAGVTGTCVLYGLVCFLGAICIYFLIPETKGKTLAEIEAHFSYQQHAWKPFSPGLDQSLSSILEQEVATIDSYSTFQ